MNKCPVPLFSDLMFFTTTEATVITEEPGQGGFVGENTLRHGIKLSFAQ